MLPVVRREAWSATLFAVDLELVMSTLPSGPGARGVVFVLTRPLHLFWATEARGALLLLGGDRGCGGVGELAVGGRL